MRSGNHPPGLTECLLRLCTRQPEREFLVGDLLEEFHSAALPQLGKRFNLFNHPNFARLVPTVTSALFGQSTQMLNRGLDGLNALYQLGGPRSIQLGVKLRF
jgi:hypothetical protein